MKFDTKNSILNIRTTWELRAALIERATQMHIKPSELVRLAIAQVVTAPIGVTNHEQQNAHPA